jgi:hypothetical protein
MRAYLLVVAVLAAACGAGFDSGPSDPDGGPGEDATPMPDGGHRPDGGPDPDGGVDDGGVSDGGTPDGPPPCRAAFDLFADTPAPGDVTAVASSGAGGLIWDVTKESTAARFPHTALTADSIVFHPDEAGRYLVQLDLGIPGCEITTKAWTAGTAGSPTGRWWIQVVPPASSSVPPYEGPVDLTTRRTLDLHLPPGKQVAIRVAGPGDRVVPSMVRFTRRTQEARRDAVPVEAYTDDAGALSARVGTGLHDLLVVPQQLGPGPALPARRIGAWTPGDAVLTLFEGQAITGRVLGAGGVAIVDARVTATIDGVPSTVAWTGADGSFALRTTVTGAARLVVVPPAGSGYPRLEATTSLAGGDVIAVRYSDALRFADLAGARVRVDGSGVGAGAVTLVGGVADAAQITVDGGAVAVRASFAAGATLDELGAVRSLRAPAIELSAVVELPTGRTAVIPVDLRVRRPDTLVVPAMAQLTGAILGGSLARAGVRVRAVPTGILAAATMATVSTTTSSTGHFAMPVAAGARYDVIAIDPSGTYAEVRRLDVGTGELGSVALTPGVVVTGTATVDGGASGELVGGSVALLCAAAGCPAAELGRPVAVAVIGANGAFRLVAPEPVDAPTAR